MTLTATTENQGGLMVVSVIATNDAGEDVARMEVRSNTMSLKTRESLAGFVAHRSNAFESQKQGRLDFDEVSS